MLIFGTATAICAKSMLQTCAKGVNGADVPFNRPWSQTMMMFFAMSFALPTIGIFERYRNGQSEAELEYSMLKERQATQGSNSYKTYCYIFAPALLDLIATTLSGCGLIWVDASVYQMLRGSLLIWSAIFSIVFLKKRLKGFHWVGIALVLTAVAMVGVASVKSAEQNSHESTFLEILGIILIIAGQAVQASQMVCEEFLMKKFHPPPHPMVIVGMEGVWGVLCMIVFLVILQYTPGYDDACITNFKEQCSMDEPPPESNDCSAITLYHEETDETLKMIGESPTLYVLVIIYCIAILMYNIAGMNVTKYFTAIHRTILEACRTLCIWIVQLFIHYVVKWEGKGEKWDDWSFLQLGGFCIMLLGTFTYSKLLKWPFLHYNPPKVSDVDNLDKTPINGSGAGPDDMAHPGLSPAIGSVNAPVTQAV